MNNDKNNDLSQLDFLDEKTLINQMQSNIVKANQTSPNKLIDERHSNESSYKKNCPEKILILDTETTGIEVEDNSVIEIGCILFHVPSKSELSQLSFLLPVNSNKAFHVNGIPPEITNITQPWEVALTYFNELLSSSDIVIAHNVEFDKKWFGRGALPEINLPWVCSMEDINWRSIKPNINQYPSVVNLALNFNIPVWNIHRALSDCSYLSEVFKKSEVNLEELLSEAIKPKKLMKALVSYQNKDLAKEAGFRWNNPVKGAWSKKLTEEELKNLSFEVVEVKDFLSN
tara:strand:- start:6748 stop:7608 length:861 start_codon:yes stop_codon:yes gene_type:complete